MSAALVRLLRGARRRRQAIVWSAGLPLALLATALGWRLGGPQPAFVVATLTLLGVAATAVWQARRIDRRALIRRLDRHHALEDSADLLFAAPATLGPLQQLQRGRLEQRLAAHAYDVREPWPWQRLLAIVLPALALTAAVLLWPSPSTTRPVASPPATAGSAGARPTLRGAVLHATPPAYTGLAAADLPALDAKLPQGSTLAWTLRFTTPPASVTLRLHDGGAIALQRDGDGWRARTTLQRSLLYRIVVDGAPLDAALHRLEAVPDRPPQVRVLEPDSSLVQWTPSAQGWTLRFEASDDHGVAVNAQLRLTLAEGSGENISFREQTLVLAGSGPATARRFARTLQPQALGLQPGSDLVAQLVVHDNRQPQPQEARSASVILRWPPPEQTRAADLEGSIKQAMPAYFRSQRQIIIDAEALLKQKRALAGEEYLRRSDAIGVDQRLLRLRYGQFLGEEAEGAPEPPPVADDIPTADALPLADDLPTADMPTADAPAPARGAHHDDDSHDHAAHAGAHDAHDHGGEPDTRGGFGDAGNVLAEFGHTHDHAEAATLLDPQTRATLKAALDQMWQSEGELRQGHPERALPFAYKALGFIKQVQQAERIYLARIGPELPPIDPARRMGGKRDGLGDRTLAPAPRTPPDPRALALWQALGDAPGDADAATLAAFSTWLSTRDANATGTLDLIAAVETLRATPECASCRQRLRARLWPLLVRPPASAQPRAAPTPAGERYLDALQRTEAR